MMYVHNLQNNITPIHYAAASNHTPVVETLVKAGADINVVDKVNQYK